MRFKQTKEFGKIRCFGPNPIQADEKIATPYFGCWMLKTTLENPSKSGSSIIGAYFAASKKF